jgi:glucose/arabinose dehydrogenase
MVAARLAAAALAVSVLAVAGLTAGCSAGPAPRPRTTTPAASPAPHSVPGPVPAPGSAPPVTTALTTIRLAVPAGQGGSPFTTPRTLRVPAGWTARVWARVPGARMEAWTPEGDLLVSQPGDGTISELVPGGGATARPRTLLSGLTQPQGMAFAKVSGRWVLYVAESDQIDRYPWGGQGIAGTRTVIVPGLPDTDPAGDDVHRTKDVVVTRDGTLYFEVGSSSNASPDDLTMNPPRAVIMAVRPDGTGLRVVERGVRNGEGLAVAPDGTVWTAVNNRDNIPYPFRRSYGGLADAFGQVLQSYVNNHPPDEVVPVVAGRDLGWPYCNPDQDENQPAGSLSDIPFVADALTNAGGTHLDCARLPPLTVGLPAHSAPLGLSFLEGTGIAAPWADGAVLAVHGSWNRVPPRSPAVFWLAWNSAGRVLEPAITLVTGFQLSDGSRWGRPVDVVPGPGPALYVSDDTAGAIYRLQPPG